MREDGEAMNKELVVYPRRLLLVSWFTCFPFLLAYYLVVPFDVSKWTSWLLTILGLPLSGIFGLLSLRRLFDRTPLLAIRQDGMDIYVLKSRYVSWEEIRTFRLKSAVRGGIILVIERIDGHMLQVPQALCPVPLAQVVELMKAYAPKGCFAVDTCDW